MDYSALDAIFGRICLQSEFSFDDMVDYAARNYWSLVGFYTDEENPNIKKEGFFKPSNHKVIIDYIEDKITRGPFIVIRHDPEESDDLGNVLQEIYDNMILKFPTLQLEKILSRPELKLSEDEIHALGKGYDPKLEDRIKGVFYKIINNAEFNRGQKKAAIIAIGYISDPKNFNSLLEKFTHDQDPEVAELAHSMLEAGQVILNQ